MKPKAALVWAAWSLWIIWGFGFYTLGNRLWAQLDGIVITSRDIPSIRGPRYVTTSVRETERPMAYFPFTQTRGALDMQSYAI